MVVVIQGEYNMLCAKSQCAKTAWLIGLSTSERGFEAINKGSNRLYNPSVMLGNGWTGEITFATSRVEPQIYILHPSSTWPGTVKAVMVKGTTVGSSPSLARSATIRNRILTPVDGSKIL